MIKELDGRDLFRQENQVFQKYFMKNEKTEIELAREKKLTEIVLGFYKKVYDENASYIRCNMFEYDFCKYGFLENYGYYIVIYDSWKQYYVHRYNEDDIATIAIDIIKHMMAKKRYQYLNEHKELKKEYKKRFNTLKFFDKIYSSEYDLSKWAIYFENDIPSTIINEYTNSLNDYYEIKNSHKHFEYNRETKQFVEKTKDKVKKRSL